MGNFLNGGTARGDCPGFKIEALLNLPDTKTLDNKSNLLMYLARTMESKFPDVAKWMEDLTEIEKSSRYYFSHFFKLLFYFYFYLHLF